MKTEFIGGERGSRSRSGSVIIIPPVRSGRRITRPEKIYVRRRYSDPKVIDPKTGKPKQREKKRLVDSRTEAKEKLLELAGEIKRDQVKVINPGAGKTFKDLAAYYEKRYLHPPDRKGDGLKSWEKLKGPLQVLRDEFSDEPLRAIDYDRVQDFRDKFAARETRHKTERSLASVHRHLELLSRMLNVARRRPLRWVSENAFADGDPLIRKSKETKRMRILTHGEEKALLAAVKTVGASGKAHSQHYRNLYPALVFAIDTAARAGEEFGTRVTDVNLDQGYIRVRGKTMLPIEERLVPITSRLAKELKILKPIKRSLSRAARQNEALKGRKRIAQGNALGNGRDLLFQREASMAERKQTDELIFDYRRPKRSFASALKTAGIDGFRWHDLRHTGIMRMLEAGVDPATVMKITGHTSWTTFMRYVNLNPELVRGVAAKIDTARSRKRA